MLSRNRSRGAKARCHSGEDIPLTTVRTMSMETESTDDDGSPRHTVSVDSSRRRQSAYSRWVTSLLSCSAGARRRVYGSVRIMLMSTCIVSYNVCDIIHLVHLVSFRFPSGSVVPGLYAGPNYCQSHIFWWTHRC